MAALSLATDLGTGQSMEHAMRSCVLAVRLGDAFHLGQEQLIDIYYLTATVHWWLIQLMQRLHQLYKPQPKDPERRAAPC